MINFYHEYLEPLASGATILSFIFLVLGALWRSTKKHIHKSKSSSTFVLGLVLGWFTLLLVSLVANGDPIKKVDIVLISGVVFSIALIIFVWLVDKDKTMSARRAKMKYDLFSIGDND